MRIAEPVTLWLSWRERADLEHCLRDFDDWDDLEWEEIEGAEDGP